MSFGKGALLAAAAAGPEEREAGTLRTGLAIMVRGCRTHPWAATGAVVSGLVNAVCMVLAARAVGWSTDHVVIPTFREGEFAAGTAALGALFVLGVSFLRIVTIITRLVATGTVQFHNEAADRKAVVAHYLRLGVSWHRRRPAGQLVSGVVSDVETAWDPMQHFPFAVGMVAMLLLVMADMVLLDWWLALVAGVLIPLVFAANLLYQRVLTPRARAAQRDRAVLSGLAHEAVAGRQVVRTLGITDHEIARFAEAADASRASNRRMGDAGAIFDPAIELMPPLASLVILAVGVSRVEAGMLGIGSLVEVVYLLITTAIPLNVIARFLGVLPLGVAGHGRMERLLSTAERPAHGQRALPEQQGGVEVELSEATFGYAPRGEDESGTADGPRGMGSRPVGGPALLRGDAAAVRELTLRVRPGEVVAVVGATGAGKSTLLSLLAHLLEADRGGVALSGVDTRLLAPTAVRRRTALVTQNPFLFADTVRANVTLGIENSTTENPAAEQPGLEQSGFERALRLAAAENFVAALPEGPDTALSDAAQLSGGQRQRLALARAVYRKPGLLLLDDATSALDPLVERAVVDALRAEYGGDDRRTTVVLVGHRAATIALADTVVFLSGGRIVAQGTHEELLDTEPGYRALLGAYDTSPDDSAGNFPEPEDCAVPATPERLS